MDVCICINISDDFLHFWATIFVHWTVTVFRMMILNISNDFLHFLATIFVHWIVTVFRMTIQI